MTELTPSEHRRAVPAVRASDVDRERTVAALQRHTVAGRLSLDEFSDRVGAVYRAATVADLAALTRDLPVLPPDAPAPSTVPAGAQHHQLAIAFLLAIVALVVLGTLLAITR